jgi:hypothetical protein
VLGRGLVMEEDEDSKFDIDGNEGEDDEFIGKDFRLVESCKHFFKMKYCNLSRFVFAG